MYSPSARTFYPRIYTFSSILLNLIYTMLHFFKLLDSFYLILEFISLDYKFIHLSFERKTKNILFS